MEDYFVIRNITNEIAQIPDDSIVSKTIHDNEHVKGVLFGFAPGQELSEHTASSSAFLYFISGEAEVTLGEDEFSIEADTWVYLPPKLPHRITALTRLNMLLILMK